MRGGSVDNLLTEATSRHTIETLLSGSNSLHDATCAESGRSRFVSWDSSVTAGDVEGPYLNLWSSRSKLNEDQKFTSPKSNTKERRARENKLSATSISSPNRQGSTKITQLDDNVFLPSESGVSSKRTYVPVTFDRKFNDEDPIRIGYRLQPLLIDGSVDSDKLQFSDDLILPEERCSVPQSRSTSGRVRLLEEVSEIVGGFIGLRSVSNSPRSDVRRSKNKSIQTNNDKSSKRSVRFSNFNGRKTRHKRETSASHHEQTHRGNKIAKRSNLTGQVISGDSKSENIGRILIDESSGNIILDRTAVLESDPFRGNPIILLDNRTLVPDSRSDIRRDLEEPSPSGSASRGVSVDRESGSVRGSGADRSAGHAQYQVAEYSFDQPDSPFEEDASANASNHERSE